VAATASCGGWLGLTGGPFALLLDYFCSLGIQANAAAYAGRFVIIGGAGLRD
jgi:hypothetical protein